MRWEHPCRWHTSENEAHLTSRLSELTSHRVSQACVSRSWTIATVIDNQGELFWAVMGPRNLQVATKWVTKQCVCTSNTLGVSSGASRDYYYKELWAECLRYAFIPCIWSSFKTQCHQQCWIKFLNKVLHWFQNLIQGTLSWPTNSRI